MATTVHFLAPKQIQEMEGNVFKLLLVRGSDGYESNAINFTYDNQYHDVGTKCPYCVDDQLPKPPASARPNNKIRRKSNENDSVSSNFSDNSSGEQSPSNWSFQVQTNEEVYQQQRDESSSPSCYQYQQSGLSPDQNQELSLPSTVRLLPTFFRTLSLDQPQAY